MEMEYFIRKVEIQQKLLKQLGTLAFDIRIENNKKAMGKYPESVRDKEGKQQVAVLAAFHFGQWVCI